MAAPQLTHDGRQSTRAQVQQDEVHERRQCDAEARRHRAQHHEAAVRSVLLMDVLVVALRVVVAEQPADDDKRELAQRRVNVKKVLALIVPAVSAARTQLKQLSRRELTAQGTTSSASRHSSNGTTTTRTIAPTLRQHRMSTREHRGRQPRCRGHAPVDELAEVVLVEHNAIRLTELPKASRRAHSNL